MNETNPDGFCARVWRDVAELVAAIHEHPFNIALADGTLDSEVFTFYLVQDARYLGAFARGLAVAAARATTADDAAFLAGSAHTALVEESRLHAGYLERFGRDEAGVATSPTCLAYSGFLRATAHEEPYPVAVAALLPCFWVYQDVGKAMYERTHDQPRHPYRAWIDTYADPEFAASVESARAITDWLARATDGETREAMRAAFVRATEYEWMFWDSAWRMEGWPTRRWLPNKPGGRG